VEQLEPRKLLTVTYQGGALLRNVEVQGVYLGSNWSTPTNASTKSQLDQFLATIVNSNYMDTLNAAGYGISRGTSSTGFPASQPLSGSVSDFSIQTILQSLARSGQLQRSDPNRLYVVFVEPGVVVTEGTATSSAPYGTIAGYHASFAGLGVGLIRYAVIVYPGVPNWPPDNWDLPTDFNQLTAVASHEIAEAVTDPDPLSAWADRSQIGSQHGPEIGDLGFENYTSITADGSTWYEVQQFADRNDQPMQLVNPAGAIRPAASFTVTGHEYIAALPGRTSPTDLISGYTDPIRGLVVRTSKANSDGTYAPAVETVLGGPGFGHVFAADLNGDGLTDLIFTFNDSAGRLNIQTALASSTLRGTFQNATDTILIGGLNFSPQAVGDVNGDGRADLIFSFVNSSGTHLDTMLASSTKPGAFLPSVDTVFTGNVGNLRAKGDFNGDGRTDILFDYHDASGLLHVKTALADPANPGKFMPLIETIVANSALLVNPVYTGDFNGDGRTDIAFMYTDTAGTLHVRAAIAVPAADPKHTGMFDVAAETLLPNGILDLSNPVLVGDVNGVRGPNGFRVDDFIFTYSSGGQLHMQVALPLVGGTAKAPTVTFAATAPTVTQDGPVLFSNPVLTGDVNGDGRTDLIFSWMPDGGVLTFRTFAGTSAGAFSPNHVQTTQPLGSALLDWFDLNIRDVTVRADLRSDYPDASKSTLSISQMWDIFDAYGLHLTISGSDFADLEMILAKLRMVSPALTNAVSKIVNGDPTNVNVYDPDPGFLYLHGNLFVGDTPGHLKNLVNTRFLSL
jgi:hypothetical protein